jgi:DNA modification methylase
MGSGSMGVAANKLGVDFIGIELNKEYFDYAEKNLGLDGPKIIVKEDEFGDVVYEVDGLMFFYKEEAENYLKNFMKK